MKRSPNWFLRQSRIFAVLVLVAVFGAGVDAGADVVPASTAADPAQRIAELRLEIANADELYFKRAAPVISDAAYDDLKRELASLEAAFPDAVVDVPANIPAIGDDRVGDFPTGRHRERMLSLRKAYTAEELRGFHEQLVKRLGQPDAAFVVEPKFDGLAISVTFERGQLVRAITRGNGDEGDDVTENILTIPSLPPALGGTDTMRAGPEVAAQIPDLIELRGEVFMSFAEFERVNAEQERNGEPPFANPRNLAAGTLKLHDREKLMQRRLGIVFYGIGACEPASARPATQRALHEMIRRWGLPGVGYVSFVRGSDAVWAAVEKIGRERHAYTFPTDGAVVKLDDVAGQLQVGATADAPNWAVAFKFVPRQAVTRILGITVQVGRTGVLTPVAELVPVELGGSTVSRASLQNFAEIARRDIRVGDFVIIEKAGEIIPAISSVDRTRRTPESRSYETPTQCPSCGRAVAQDNGRIAVRCVNGECPAQLRRRLAHFAGKSGVGIQGLGPSMIDKLVTAGAIKTIADIYRLPNASATSSGAVPGSKLLTAIERSKRVDLWRFVNGLGIPEVGERSAQALARRFGGLVELASATRADFFDGDLCRVEGVSRAAGEATLAYFARSDNRVLIDELVAAGVDPVLR